MGIMTTIAIDQSPNVGMKTDTKIVARNKISAASPMKLQITNASIHAAFF